jgi:hypothetical protein
MRVALAQRGVVAPSRWIYVAEVVASKLHQSIQTGAIEEPYAGIPLGVYRQATALLISALEAKGGRYPVNRSSHNTNTLVADSTSRNSERIQRSPAVSQTFSQFQDMMERLKTPGPLSEDEIRLMEEIYKFFLWVAKEGEAQILRRNTRHHVLSSRRAASKLG